MSTNILKAVPLSRNDIVRVTRELRGTFSLTECKMFPILLIIETILPVILKDYNYEILPKDELDVLEAKTIIDSNTILIREDVYINAYNGVGRDRFTLAHELGHFFLHRKKNISFARSISHVPTYCDPEWQANAFAGELLMPRELIKDLDPYMISKYFGVSYKAAKYQYDKLKSISS